MSPEINAYQERICATCAHYGFKPGNPKGWRWACCKKKGFWFDDKEAKPGERKGCEEWQ